MRRVAECESRDRQYNQSGEVVIGNITPDIGRFQINPVHLSEARKRGIDVYTTHGNARMAEILYNRNGLRDWQASRHCWSQYLHTKRNI
jgi:hypothetical protein